MEECREEEMLAKRARVSAPEQTEGRPPLSTGDKREAEAIVLTASGESDEASETDAGRTEAKRRRGGDRTAAEEGERASRARAVDVEDEESMQAGDAAHNDDDEEDGGAVPVAMKKRKHKKRRGKSRAQQVVRTRAKRRDDKRDVAQTHETNERPGTERL